MKTWRKEEQHIYKKRISEPKRRKFKHINNLENSYKSSYLKLW